jgi:hypothetical protein
MVESAKTLLEKRKPRISVDAEVSFTHGGRKFRGKLKKTEWNGPGEPMTYIWQGPQGGEVRTKGVPEDLDVIADVPRRNRT